MKHVSINTNDSRDSKLEELGIKTITVKDAGMYGNRHVVYTYDNKLWIGSGYESFSPGSTNQYHYDNLIVCFSVMLLVTPTKNLLKLILSWLLLCLVLLVNF